MAEYQYKRKTLLVKKAFQLKYTGVILLFILLTVFLAGLTTYYAVFPYLSEKLANVYPQSRLISILTNANLKLLYSSSIPIILAIWIGIMLSHRIAGPWYRLENLLSQIAKGRVVDDIILRKGDELKSLADAINRVIDRLKINRETTVKHINILEEYLSQLEQILKSPQLDAASIKQTVIKLESSLHSLRSIVA